MIRIRTLEKRLCESSQSRELGHTVVILASNTLEQEFPDKNNITEPWLGGSVGWSVVSYTKILKV